uniref:uncharacterized protein LOC120340842 isoform X1 n=1 Tax=Styela clava TaxID=7725 RepID=UPI00193A0CF2|nr:uncharacterized protein LOC120340842 isoform X1 [Styela clava]
MKTAMLLLLLAVLCSTSIGRTLHERKRRVAGIEYDTYLDKDPANDDDYYEYDEYDIEEDDLFSCFTGGEQVPHFLMCDGYKDCTDGSDEIPANCEELGISTPPTSTTSTTTTTTTTPTTTTTTATTTTTTASLPPVEPNVRKPEDYGDYEDACTEEEFQCQSDLSICLPQTQVCDGIHDCPDKEDEANCTELHFESIPVIPHMRPVFEGGLDFDTFDIDHTPSKDIKAAPNDIDYIYYIDNRNGVAISLPDVLNGADDQQKAEPTSFKPPVVIMKPPPQKPDVPILIPSEKQENNANDLALESDYDYIMLGDEDDIRRRLLEKVPGTETTKSNDTDNHDVSVLKDGEIEINHNTGEIILFENGEVIPLSSEPAEAKREESLLTTVEPKIISPEHTTKSTTVAMSTTSQSDDNETFKLKKKIEKQRKKFRGIVAQLLHQMGKLVETGADSEPDNTIQTNININVGTGIDLSSAGSLYSRLLSQSSFPNSPRLRISVDVQL